MAVTYNEVSSVIGPWGGDVLKNIDLILGDKDGWIEDSDFLLSGVDPQNYTPAQKHAVQESLDYCYAFRSIPDLYDDTLLATIDQLTTPTNQNQMPSAQLFHDTALGCIAAASTVPLPRLAACLVDYVGADSDQVSIQPSVQELEAAAAYPVDFDDAVFTRMTNEPVFDDPVFQERQSHTNDQEGPFVLYQTKAMPNISPEEMVYSIVSTDLYRSSAFGYKYLKASSILRVDAEDPNMCDVLSVSSFLGINVIYVLRQQQYFDPTTQEYVIKISALPQTQLYHDLLSRLGWVQTDEKADEEFRSEWRIKSDGNGGSLVFLASTVESSLPGWVKEKIYGFIMSYLFKSYLEGFEVMQVTRNHIMEAGAWERPG